MQEKVLIACPSHAVKNYCISEYVANVLAMKCDFLLVDNTKDNANKAVYDSLPITWMHCDPTNKSNYQAITDSQNEIRNYFLKGDYTHLFFIESDLFPPRYVLHKLLAHKKPVVGFPYFIYNNSDIQPMIQNMSLGESTYGLMQHKNIKQSFNSFDGKLQRATCIGFGCVMIERSIIEAVEFRCTPDEYTKGEAHADSFFYADLARYDIPVFLDTSLIITHKNQDWVKKIEMPDVLA